MNTFLRYLVYWCIVLYIIGWILIAFSRILEYSLGSTGTHEGVVAHRYRPLLEIYLILIKEVLKKVDIESRCLPLVPDRLKTQEMCEKVVEKYLWLLKYVPDWFLTHQQIKIWHDNDGYCNDDELIKWWNGYQKTQGPESKNKRRTFTRYLAPIKVVGFVCSWGWEKRNRNVVGIKHGPFCVWWPIQKIFEPKGTKNKDIYCVECF